MSKKQISLDNLAFWEADEETLTPFYKWEESNDENESTAIVEISKPLESYKLKKINGKYGTSHYIEVVVNNQLCLFRVDSVRLRKALKEGIALAKAKFPVKLALTRSGEGFRTQYSAVILAK